VQRKKRKAKFILSENGTKFPQIEKKIVMVAIPIHRLPTNINWIKPLIA
jgi:hypothetical protein